MRITALVEAMVAAGATPDMILVAVRATEAANEQAMEQSRDKTRARVAKWREKNAGNVTDGVVTVTNGLRAGDARVEVKTSNLDIEPQEKKQTAQSARVGDLQEFRSALSPLVDAERLESYVKHRKAKRGQLTGHAARLFLADAAACSMSPAEAVDACISRNWITVKPEYFAGRSRAPPPLQKPETTRDVGTRLLAEMRSANGQPGTSDSRHQRALVAIPGGRDTGTG